MAFIHPSSSEVESDNTDESEKVKNDSTVFTFSDNKESYLLKKMCLKKAIDNDGILFGGCIFTYFVIKNGSKKFLEEIRRLKKQGKDANADDLYDDPNFHPQSYMQRTSRIRDIDVFFYDEDRKMKFVRSMYEIAGVYSFSEKDKCPTYSSHHIIFSTYYKIQKYVLKYKCNASLSSPFSPNRRNFTVLVDIITPKSSLPTYSSFNRLPTFFMQDITIKQLTWDKNGVHPPSSSHLPISMHFPVCFDTITYALDNKTYITRETPTMRLALFNLVHDAPERDVLQVLREIINSRIIFITRVIVYLQKFCIPNSPLITVEEVKGEECGICFSTKNSIDDRAGDRTAFVRNVYKWYKWKENSTYYCFDCIRSYLLSLGPFVSQGYEEDKTSSAYKYHKSPILGPKQWRFLTDKQIYLIENIFECPVGNLADFSV